VRRWLGVTWALVCLVVAINTAAQMLVSFAPSPSTADPGAELAGLERGRRFWWAGVWLASAMLAVSGLAVAALAWRRDAEPAAAADGGPKAGRRG
jgi:hypothetical protein